MSGIPGLLVVIRINKITRNSTYDEIWVFSFEIYRCMMEEKGGGSNNESIQFY